MDGKDAEMAATATAEPEIATEEEPFTFIELPLPVRLSVYQTLAFPDLQSLRLANSIIQDDIDGYIGLIPTLPLHPRIPSNIWEYIRKSYFQNILIKGDCRFDSNLQGSEEFLYTRGYQSLKSLEFSFGCATSLPLASYLLNNCCNIVELNFSGMIEGGFFTDANAQNPIEKFQFNNLKRLKIDGRGGAWSPYNIGNSGKWFTSQISLLELIECPGVKDVSLSLFSYRVEPSSLQILTHRVLNFTRKLLFLESIQISLRQKEGLIKNEEIPTVPAQDPENPSEDLSPLLLLNQRKLKNFTLVSIPEGDFNISSMKLEYLTEDDQQFNRFVPIIPPPEGSSYFSQVSRNLVSLSMTLSIGANSEFRLGDFGRLDNLKHIKIFNYGDIELFGYSPILQGLDAMENKVETMIFENFQITTADFSAIVNKYKDLKNFGTSGRYDFNYEAKIKTGMEFDCFKTLVNSRCLEGLFLPTNVIRTESPEDRFNLSVFKRQHLRSFLNEMDVLLIADDENQHCWIPQSTIASRAVSHVFYH